MSRLLDVVQPTGGAGWREALLDAAYDAAAAGDWDRVRLAHLAAKAGVSRQSVYNEFGSRGGIAQALTMREAERFLAGVDATLDEHEQDPARAVEAATTFTLTSAADNPLLKAILSSARGTDGLLPFLTTRAEPMLLAARQHLGAYLSGHWPHLSAQDVTLVAETVVRLTVSHLVLPTGPVERTARDLADLVHRLLPAPPDAPSGGPR